MRARRYAAFAALVLVGLVALVVVIRTFGSAAGTAAPINADHNVATDIPPAAARARVPQGTFDSMRPQLETAAAAGDADAAFRMGQALAHCLDYKPLADGQVSRLVAELIATADGSIRIGGRPLSDGASIDAVLFAQQEAQRICADTASLRASAPALSAYQYIEQAAKAGHPGAGALYPELAFLEFRTPIELIDNAEEVDSRRNRARAYLLSAVRAGEPEALLAASRAFSEDGWLPRDPEQALAYWIAYTTTDDFSRIPESLSNNKTAELEGMVTEVQRERAASLAARVMDRERERRDAH